MGIILAWPLYDIILFFEFHELGKIRSFSANRPKKKLKFCSIFCCNFQKNMLLLKKTRTLLECSGAFMLIPSLPNLYGICLLILYHRQFSPVYYLFWSYDPTAVSRYAKKMLIHFVSACSLWSNIKICSSNWNKPHQSCYAPDFDWQLQDTLYYIPWLFAYVLLLTKYGR